MKLEILKRRLEVDLIQHSQVEFDLAVTVHDLTQLVRTQISIIGVRAMGFMLLC